jgi:2-polyprenyl-3-methyl-5-hydroxy-6-metoxy-1,4-benzoquinol methylase
MPIRSTLLEIGAIVDSRVQRFAERTRDRDVPVWHDPVTGVIFIDDFYVGNAEYESGQYRESSKSLEDLSDTERRVSHFRPLYAYRSVLDFGCGEGSFLRSINSVARHTQGVELQDSFRHQLNRDGVDCFSDLAECSAPETAFMFHVLEHLPNPLPTLSAIREMLASTNGGTLVVEVPHARDFLIAHARSQAFINFTLWSQHLVLHTRQSLELLLRAAGYTNIHIYGVQRYGLANHFRWLIEGLPGGHKSPLAAIETPSLVESYESALVRIDASDTLVAIAR